MDWRDIRGWRCDQLMWLGLTVILAALAALDILALTYREALVTALPLALRQPLLDMLVIALPLLPAFAIRAAGRVVRAPFVVAHPSVSAPTVLAI